MELLLATTNTHKAKEIETLLQTTHSLKTLASFPNIPAVAEDGRTFRDNAVKKAVTYARASGLLTIADDSGLCVDALEGAPGIYSARFAGPVADDFANCAKLLRLLCRTPREKRTAHYACWIALARPEGLIEAVSGQAEGVILSEMRGTNGFGYDPLFFYPPLNKTFAELSDQEKNAVSHRSKALLAIKKALDIHWRAV